MKIYSIHYNKPEYIEFQNKTLKKFAKFEYEFIIVDNSINSTIKRQIKSIVENLSLRYIDCYNTITTMSSNSHLNSFNYLFNDVKDGDTIMILDHDIFLYNNLELSYYEDYDIVFLPQTRGNVIYPWPGMIIFKNIKNKSQINFNNGLVENELCDTGGNLYYYIKNNNFRIKNVNENHIYNSKILGSELDNIFFHLISGSDWNKNYDLQEKLKLLNEKYLSN